MITPLNEGNISGSSDSEQDDTKTIVTRFDSFSFGRGLGERALAQTTTTNVAAGFSPAIRSVILRKPGRQTEKSVGHIFQTAPGAKFIDEA